MKTFHYVHTLLQCACRCVSMCVCVVVFCLYSDSESHLWFEDWWTTKLRNHFWKIGALILLLVFSSGFRLAECAREQWCPTYVWYSNRRVMRWECTDHHVSFSLSSHHTRMHNLGMSEYLQKEFWSHCDLMTLRGKTKSGTCRAHWMFCTFCEPQQMKGSRPITSNWLTRNLAVMTFSLHLLCLRCRGVVTNNNSNNRTTNHFLSGPSHNISPGLYYAKYLHGSYSMFPKGRASIQGQDQN